MKKILIGLASNTIIPSVVVGLVSAGVASAAGGVVAGAPTLVGSADSLAPAVFCPIINVMFWVLISISIIMVLYAAYLYVIAADDAAKPSQARKMILYAAIGVVIALLAKGAPSIIFSLFGTSITGSAIWTCSGS
jgi:hypothetical protein